MNGTLTNFPTARLSSFKFSLFENIFGAKISRDIGSNPVEQVKQLQNKSSLKRIFTISATGLKISRKGAFLWPLRIFVPLSSMRISPFFVDLMSGASVFYRASFFFFSSLCIFLVPLKRNGSRPKKCHFFKKWITRIKEYKRRINVVGFCCSIELFLSSHVQIILNYRNTAMVCPRRIFNRYLYSKTNLDEIVRK